MTVEELIAKLRGFDGALQVTISDGYDLVFYHTNHATVELFCGDRCSPCVDIGVGGCRIDDEDCENEV